MSNQQQLFQSNSATVDQLSLEAVLMLHKDPKPTKVKQPTGIEPTAATKYKSKGVVIQGIYFHSTGEANYWLFLQDRLRGGYIKKLQRQVKFPFEINGVTVTSYKADYVVTNHDGSIEVIDYKSMFTIGLEPFQIKKSLMLALYGVEIKCVGKNLESATKKPTKNKFQKSFKKVSKFGK